MSRPIAIRNPQFYTPDELQDSLYHLLAEVPTHFYGVYLSSRGEGLKWITHRAGNFAPHFTYEEIRQHLPNATDQQLQNMIGYREIVYCLMGLCKLWKHFDGGEDELVDSTGQVVPEENRWIFDPVELAGYDYQDLESRESMTHFLEGVRRIRISDYTAPFTTQDSDFRYANAMYTARDNLAQGLRLDDDSGIDE